MAYNPYTAINEIYNLKGQWGSANNAGDEAKKNEAAAKAQTYYNQLKSNGYTGVANQLSASDYASAKAIRDKHYTLATADKTKTRPYLYSLGAKYGLSNSDVDKLISYDDVSGQVSFGGKVVGTPDTVVDGTSYWSDTSILDNAFNDYVSRSGLTRSGETQVTQENENLFAKYNQEYEDLKNTNPFTTDEAKAILAKYDLAGLQGRDNAVASGSASNGGNIDSFSAANALRQQASMITEGQGVVLEQYQQKLDHARNLLSDMGVNIDRVYNQNETSKNNEVARQQVYSDISGTVGDTVTKALNSNIWNTDGSLKDYNMDYSTAISELETTLASTTDETEKTRIKEQLRLLEAARNQKIDEQGLSYGKTYKYQGSQRTAEYDLTQQQITSAEKIAAADNTSAEKIAAADNTSAEKIAAADNASAEKINAANNAVTQQQINASLEATRLENEKDAYAGYNVLLSMWPTNEVEKRAFIEEFIKPLYESGTAIPPESLKQLIVANSTAYNIDVDDATKICQAYGVSTDWLSGYRDRTASDGNVTWYDGSIHEGQYGGMVKK